MSNTVIKVENISKQYRLGEVGTGTLSHDINRWWYRLRGKEDPYLKVGEENDRTKKGDSQYVWALRDIDFEVKQGEVLGVIGRNGAGKSTLLKILSRTTTPSQGSVKVKGKVASLLEVGTGFHPELTGRENVFLNGAILGMTKKEIRNKFDEIVDFAGVERYIDTPVKRYSSGMYVRLAFGVAAYLEPDILIVDEVLAVGDAEFQKKALGKMKDVSKGQGRTVLFVSHNMGTISQLCDKSIMLGGGRVVSNGLTKDVITEYLVRNNRNSNFYKVDPAAKKGEIYFESVYTINSTGTVTENFQFDESIILDVRLRVRAFNSAVKLSFTLQNINGEFLSTFVEGLSEHYGKEEEVHIKIKLPSHLIAPNNYYFRFAAFVPNDRVYDLIEMICPVRVFDNGTNMSFFDGINYGSFTMNYEIV